MLKDGSESQNPRLDRIYEEDWRSLNYPITAKLTTDERVPRSKTWAITTTLDQGNEGACVGFGYTHDILAEPEALSTFQDMPVDASFARTRVYWEAQKLDEWDGGSYPGASPTYEGSSVLAGAKVLVNLGLYSAYHWGLNLQQVVLGIGYDGPAVLGLKWMRGMQRPDSKGFIHPTGTVDGGHCILAYGVEIVFKSGNSKTWKNVDLYKSYIKLHNSWGPDWGINGNCYISLKDFETLLNDRGEACFPDRIPVLVPTPPAPPAPTPPAPPAPEPEPITPTAVTYRTKPSIVEAIQYTGRNFTELLKFAPGKIAHNPKNEVVARVTSGGKPEWVVVSNLFWVVSNPGNRDDIWIVGPSRFNAMYELNT